MGRTGRSLDGGVVIGNSLPVIIDTNFAIFATEMRVDLRDEFRRLFGASYELVLLPEVVMELRRLKKRVPLKILGITEDGQTRGSAGTEKPAITISADDAIIEEVARQNELGRTPAVCTMDAMLKKRLKARELRFIQVVVRGKAQLSVV